jgi:hypothetical protein
LLLIARAAAVGEPPTKGPSGPLTAEQQQRLKQCQGYVRAANLMATLGKDREAIAALRKAIVLHREVLGAVNEAYAHGLDDLAGLYAKRNEFTEAVKARREALEVRTRLYGADQWRVTDTRLAIETIERASRLSAADLSHLREADGLDAQAK